MKLIETSAEILNRETFDIQTAKGILSISRQAVYQAIRDGRLTTVEIHGRKLIDRNSVEAYTKKLIK